MPHIVRIFHRKTDRTSPSRNLWPHQGLRRSRAFKPQRRGVNELQWSGVKSGLSDADGRIT